MFQSHETSRGRQVTSDSVFAECQRERERCFLSSIRGGSKIHRTLTHTCFVKVYSKEENSDPLFSGVIVQVLNQWLHETVHGPDVIYTMLLFYSENVYHL